MRLREYDDWVVTRAERVPTDRELNCPGCPSPCKGCEDGKIRRGDMDMSALRRYYPRSRYATETINELGLYSEWMGLDPLVVFGENDIAVRLSKHGRLIGFTVRGIDLELDPLLTRYGHTQWLNKAMESCSG